MTPAIGEPSVRKILTIDGGGIKGMVPAALLADFEAQLGAPVVDYFDLIVGTSTGGIIAAALALGYSAREVVEIYRDDGARIFPSAGFLQRQLLGVRAAVTCRYDTHTLRKVLQERFGNKLLGEARCRLVIPSFSGQTGEVYVLKTRHSGRFHRDHKKSVVEALVSTASAPTYFASSRQLGGSGLIDGGVWSNNPMLLAAVEAVGVLKWPATQIRLLSLGCTEEALDVPASGGRLRFSGVIADLFLRAQSSGSRGGAYLLLGDDWNAPKRVFRIVPTVAAGRYSLGGHDQVDELQGIGEELARRHFVQVKAAFFDAKAAPFVPLPDSALPEAIA